MTDIFSPSFKKDQNYGLSKSVKTQMNNEAIIPILSDSIYKDPLSSIRELYNNEITACLKAKSKDAGLIQEIEICYESGSRELIIHGKNSLGISKDVFKNILSVMGNSGNNQGDQIGYFGLGFFSHVKISEKMIVHTKTQNESYSFISKSGISFEFLPDEFCENLKQTGTKIILTVKDSVNDEDLTNFVKELVILAPIKTKFYFDKQLIELKQYSSLKQYVKSIYSDFYNHINPQYCFRMYQEINADFELFIINTYGNKDYESNKSFLISSPVKIDFESILKKNDVRYNNFRVYLKIKNERMFKPHVSRDYLTSEADKLLADMLAEHFKIFKADNPQIKINNEDHNYKKISIVKFFNDKEKWFYDFNKYLNVKVVSQKHKRQLTYHLSKLLFSFENQKVKGVSLVSGLKDDEAKMLSEHGFILLGVSPNDKKDLLNTFKGFIDKKQIYIKYNIEKIPREKNVYDPDSVKELKIHSSKYYDTTPIIFSVKNPSQYSSDHSEIRFCRLNQVGDEFYVIADIPKLKYFKNKVFLTQDGYKTLDQLDRSYAFTTSQIFRKYLPVWEKYAFCGIMDKYERALIELYFDANNLFKSFTPFKNYVIESKNKQIRKLIDCDYFNDYKIDSYQEYLNMVEIFGDV